MILSGRADGTPQTTPLPGCSFYPVPPLSDPPAAATASAMAARRASGEHSN